jgi:hypothetical protein
VKTRRYVQLSLVVVTVSCGLLLPSKYGREIVLGGEFLPESKLFIRGIIFAINQGYINFTILLSYLLVGVLCLFAARPLPSRLQTRTKGSGLIVISLLLTTLCAIQVQAVQKFQGGFPLTRNYSDDLASVVQNNDEGEKLTSKWLGILQIKNLVGNDKLYISDSILTDDLKGIGMINNITTSQSSSLEPCRKEGSEFKFIGYLQDRKIFYRVPISVNSKNYTLTICGSEIVIF